MHYQLISDCRHLGLNPPRSPKDPGLLVVTHTCVWCHLRPYQGCTVWPRANSRSNVMSFLRLGHKKHVPSIWGIALSLLDHSLRGKPCGGALEGGPCGEVQPSANSYMSELEADPSEPVTPQMTAALNDWHTERLWARTTHISCTLIPDPQKLWNKKCLL